MFCNIAAYLGTTQPVAFHGMNTKTDYYHKPFMSGLPLLLIVPGQDSNHYMQHFPTLQKLHDIISMLMEQNRNRNGVV